MNKSEVYTWRLSPVTKAALEEEARKQNRSIADLLEEIVTANLGQSGQESDAERQRSLHARAAEYAGRFSGHDSRRAERARERVRARLKKRQSVAD